MDAKIVWDTWRKILRDETLQHQLITKKWQSADIDGFSTVECEVIAAYADNIDRAKWFIENYQFRLVNSFINALETGAPLTLRALLNRGTNIDTLSREFLRDHHWHDYGPRVYTYCRDALEWLMNSQIWPGELLDLMGLEYQVVMLYLSLQAPIPAHDRPAGYSYSGMARIYQSQYRLSQWLRDKKSLGITMPQTGEENLLIVLPDLDSRHKYLLVPPRCAALYRHLPDSDEVMSQDDQMHLQRLLAANALHRQEV